MTDRSHQSDDRSVGEITSDLFTHTQELVRSEIRLAKFEVREEAKTAARGAAVLVAGAILALYAFGMLLFTAVWALSTALDLWLSALIVAAVVGVAAAALIAIGRSRLQQVEPKPDQTAESMKENVEWAKRQKP